MQAPEEILQDGINLCQQGNLRTGIVKFREALKKNPRPGTLMLLNHNLAYALSLDAGVVWGQGGRVPVNKSNMASLDEAVQRWDEVCRIYQEEVKDTSEETAFSGNVSLKEYMKTAINNSFAITVKLQHFRGEGSFKKQTGPVKKGGGCFIATAAFENSMSPEVIYLQRYRDNVLSKSRIGRLFIKLYYFISPCIAKVISHSNSLKRLTRQLILKPIIRLIGNFF